MKRSLTLTLMLAVLVSLMAISGGYCEEPSVQKSSSGTVLAQADEKAKQPEAKKNTQEAPWTIAQQLRKNRPK